MTEEQKENIIRLRYCGWGYRTIATAVNLSRDSVRNYCKAHGLDGWADEILLQNKKFIDSDVNSCNCIVCGKQFEVKSTGRPRKYCSTECKREYEKMNPKIYSHECLYCGVKFESRSSNQKFCCHECYTRNRFWKEEDVNEIMKLLLSGENICKIPKLLKDLIIK